MTFDGDWGGTIGSGDSLFFSITENSGSGYCSGGNWWELFAEDSTANHYQDSIFCIGGGIYDVPYSSMHYALIAGEGSQAASSSYFPGTFTFTSVWGQSTSGSDQLGTSRDWKYPVESTGVTATIFTGTYSCTEGTCGQDSVGWS